MTCHISPLKNNSENRRESPDPMSRLSIENNKKTLEKIYYNLLRIINDEFSQHVSMPRSPFFIEKYL
jgi:hypothetical protein